MEQRGAIRNVRFNSPAAEAKNAPPTLQTSSSKPGTRNRNGAPGSPMSHVQDGFSSPGQSTQYGAPMFGARGLVNLKGPDPSSLYTYQTEDLTQFDLPTNTRSPVRRKKTKATQDALASGRSGTQKGLMNSLPSKKTAMSQYLSAALSAANGAVDGIPSFDEDPDLMIASANGLEVTTVSAGLMIGQNEQDMDEDFIAKLNLKTGEDTINFFAKYGAQSPIKFVHLIPADTGLNFRPYDLVVVHQREVVSGGTGEVGRMPASGYYTMSAAGLVHVLPGQPSEFIPLNLWMRQSTLFNMCRSIRFYKYYLHTKCFVLWRSNVRYKLYCQQRHRLAHSLFLAKQTFCSPLLDLKGIMLEMQQVKLLECQKAGAFDMQEFIDKQNLQRQTATKHLDACMEKVQAIVHRVREDVTKLARSADVQENPLEHSIYGSSVEKAKSIVALKQEQAARKTQKRRAEQEAGMLPDFIRCVDYVCVETLVALIVRTQAEFNDELSKSRKAGLFETTVQFEDQLTVFNPKFEDIRAMITEISNHMINTIKAVPRIFYTPGFHQYVKGIVRDGPVLETIIRSSREFNDITAEIVNKVAHDFDEAKIKAQEFDSFRPIFEFNKTFSYEEYRKEKHGVQKLQQKLLEVTTWIGEMDRMKTKLPCGILEVEARNLKGSLLPATKEKLEKIKQLVKELARKAAKEHLEEYKTRCGKVNQRPILLRDFATQVEVLEDLKKSEKRLADQTKKVEQMYQLLAQHQVAVAPEDEVQLDDLRAKQEEYVQQMGDARVYKDERMPEMTHQLDMNIAQLGEGLGRINTHLAEGAFIDVSNFEDPESVLADLETVAGKLDSFDQMASMYSQFQALFGISVFQYKNLAQTKEQFQQTQSLWNLVSKWNTDYNKWMVDPFVGLNVEEMEKEVQVFFKEAHNLHKRMNNDVTSRLKEQVTDMKSKMPLVLELGNPAMKARHWEKIFHALNQPYLPDVTFSLEELLNFGIVNQKELVSEISGTASGEAQLEASLEQIRDGWDGQNFSCLLHRDQADLFILGGLEDIYTLLDDNQVTLQTMMGSRFIMGVQAEVEVWAKKLTLLSETLDEWVSCQRNWMYLETIFSGEDIAKQLPAESQKFKMVDKSWKKLMKDTNENPKVIAAVDDGNATLRMLSSNNKVLEDIQKSLEDYLETKRMAFPRFYFLSNDELLEILSQTRDPQAVQPHMSKCFDAIKSIKFGQGRLANEIYGLSDPGSEYIQFREPIKAEGPVESWLKHVEYTMMHTLFLMAKSALQMYPPHGPDAINRAQWLWSSPAQVVIVIDQVVWTANLGTAIWSKQNGTDPEAVKKFLEFSLEQIEALVDLVRGELSRQQRTLMGALITIDVHARDVVREMVAQDISSLTDFEWTRQLRYYWDESADDVRVRQTNTCFPYGYEYLGNGPRLVITPLTDICYMTLTGALHMRLGGAPAGPAGTGKTETTKDLAKALAIYCVVFNCSDGLDYKIMGRFFSGLAQQGAWACFDEFNRIDIEVLSVIAQQMLCIQQAISIDAKEFEFEGQMIPLAKGFGVFITMNPGYAGRTELPDNLKALFRPVAMMVPDYRLIAEIVLFSEGFANALPLSNKMAQLYALSSEQLSKQDHYDFGMRAVKSVLVAAGQLKRKGEPGTNEDHLLIRAMRDSNVPKFLQHDLPLFHGIVSDLFPGEKVPYVDYGVLETTIKAILKEEGLQRAPAFITKVIQIHETQLVRHGMMVVGEAGSGKSTATRILAQSLGRLFEQGVTDKDGFFQKVECLILNPKSITAGELYGSFNLLTNEWTDGLVPKLVRQCVGEAASGERKWVVFDGPVDAVWIENMNTVLDDNKTLCLANSERIKLPTTLHMMFEVQDLKVASPATVSRCGMVYTEQIQIGMQSLVISWIENTGRKFLHEELADDLQNLIMRHLEAGIEFVRDNCTEIIPSNNHNLTTSLLNLLESLFDPARGMDPNHPGMIRLLKIFFVWSFVWSVGGNLNDITRPKFVEWIRERFGTIADASSGFLDNPFGFVVDADNMRFSPWESLMETFTFDIATPYFNLLVPTAETTRYSYILDRCLCSGFHCLFMGNTGVGKSVIIQSFLDKQARSDSYVAYTMNYSAQTKPKNLREILEGILEKKRKTLLGPPAGKRMLMFIDDLNMPALEEYGAQPPNELLRQIIDQGGFYDTGKLFFKQIKDVVVCSSCAPPGGGRNEVSPRLIRHFNMLWLTQLSSGSMNRIFSSIFGGFIEKTSMHMTELVRPIVSASVEIYERVEKELLPTPSKSHYTFNLRDLSKVFQGMLMVKGENARTKHQILLLWCHEKCRVFRDRLINVEDRDWFNQLLKEMLLSKTNEDWDVSDFKDTLYGDYMSSKGSTAKDYKEIPDRSLLLEVLNEYLEEYNINMTSQMHLVMFEDAINHVSRICRVLRQPRGNACLVGVGGSGRQSLTRLAAFMAEYKCKSIEIRRGYGLTEFREDLKAVLMTAGAENTSTVFLFSDTQIVEESFLEDINNILNSGEVPNLYEADEVERIVNLVRPLAKQAGKLENRDVILQHYVQLVRENLHVVLCMSPIGSGFRSRCRMFPSIVNCCTINWFSAWPDEALFSVAKKFFQEQGGVGIAEFMGPLCEMAVSIHQSVKTASEKFAVILKRRTYTTPTSYLELIKLYIDMLQRQRGEVSANEQRYRVGLKTIEDTKKIVADLQVQLTELQPTLDKASEETANFLIKVQAEQKDADAQQAVVEEEVQAANKVAAEVKTMKDDCQADLDEAMPAYFASIKALDALDKKSIQELKSFTNPPEMVGYTMEAVDILLGVKPKWEDSKKLLGDPNFMQKLMQYDKDNIPVKVIRQLKTYIVNPRFQPDEVRKVSEAATCLCMWVHAMSTYDRVAKTIEPKKIKLAAAEADLEKVMTDLQKSKDALNEVLRKVAGLKAQLKATEQKKRDLENQKIQTVQRLQRAEQLIGGLSGERVRWEIEAVRLRSDLTNLVGNMMLAAGNVAYLGPFTSEFRKELATTWVGLCKKRHIPVAEDFSVARYIVNPVTLRDWQLNGLPADEFSSENGIFATTSRRWPLMIDPQGQANRWVRNMYQEKNLQVIKLTEKDFLRTLENGIRYGAPVLLENVEEELDPSLEPVLLKQIFKKAGQFLIRLGDSDVPFNEEFKFFITTKLANPHYMPEVCIKVTVINFTVTMTGLEEQLLVEVVKNERPDLEAKKDALVVSIANDQKTLKDIENKILHMLENVKGNILDDEKLIATLGDSKVTSEAINQRLAEATITTNEIQEVREQYRVVATRGSIIYFVIANLALLDPMYQYSLQFYKELFVQRLQRSEKNDDLNARLVILLDDITLNMYNNVCRGLFEKDKLLYAFMIGANIMRHSKQISSIEWRCLTIGPGTAEPEMLKNNKVSKTADWLMGKIWNDLLMMEHIMPESFKNLPGSVLKDEPLWYDVMFGNDLPHTQPLPGLWQEKLSPFQQMLVLRAFREEKVVFAIRRFVGRCLKPEFMESPPFDLEACYNDSTNLTPLIFILSPGADINDYLRQLAINQGKSDALKIISLGQGQGPIAEGLMERGAQLGDWVCLQNCHLSVSWLPRLEQYLEEISKKPESINSEFRLWLTSMPSPRFPVPILQNGIKITNEPPKGLRANLLRTYVDMTEAEFEQCPKKHPYKKLLFATAFFNALILERRKFGAVGWNIPYGWMNSDLKAAIMQVKMYVEEQDELPWTTLNVLVADITYGGRVTDRLDKRAISSILKAFFIPELMNDDFAFSESGVYYAPPEGDLQATRDYVRGLPMEDPPDIFGLHPNADITFQQKETKSLLDAIINLSGSDSAGDGAEGQGGSSTDEQVAEIARNIENRMPDIFNLKISHPTTFEKIDESTVNSLGVFLGQELVRFNGLIVVMRATLKDLQKAIKGIVVMSGPLENMYNCFLFQKVPPEWENAGYPCLKPLASWTEDFFARITFMMEWLMQGPRLSYWLSGFFFPQGFMTAVKQTYSRKYKIAVDTLMVGCEFTDFDQEDVDEAPEDGTYIHGLFMEGGRFDRSSMTLAESYEGKLFDSIPCIWLKPVVTAQYFPEDVYSCPLYKTSIRAGTLSTTGHSTNFVVALDTPSDESQDHWICRGCAMLCMLDT